MDNKGFGLLQAMLIAGLTAASAMYLYTRAKNTKKEIRASLYRQEILTFTNRIADSLSDSKVCSDVFGGLSFGMTIAQIYHPSVGTIVKTNDLIGSNSAFRLEGISIERHTGAFAKIVLQLNLENIYKNSAFIPLAFTREIPIFAHIAGNSVIDCYYDPGDPDYNDNNPNGVISRAIKRICKGPTGNNIAQASLDMRTMKCNIPGFNHSTLPNISQNHLIAGGVFYSNGQINLRKSSNQFWLPGKTCRGGYLAEIASDGKIICRPVAQTDINNAISTSSTNCYGQGFGVLLKNNQIGVGCL